MPDPVPDHIPTSGFVLHVMRDRVEKKGSGPGTRYRTVGSYQCFMDGVLLDEHDLRGASAEPRGPGDNSDTGVNFARRIEPGTYPLGTHTGERYGTFGYSRNGKLPGIMVHDTDIRTFILVHPGKSFKSSVGCINLTGSLVGPHDNISARVSFGRVDTLIRRMRDLLDPGFPASGAHRMDAFLVVDGDPEEGI